MIVSFKCSERTKDQLDDLLERGSYRSYGEAIQVAIQNLAALHDEAGSSDAVFGPKVENDPSEHSEIFTGQDGKNLEEEGEGLGIASELPTLFNSPGIEYSALESTYSPDSSDAEIGFLPVDEWIFGQCNKLLPVIANCRALANIIHDSGGEGVELEEVSGSIAESAAVLGSYLRRHDEQFGLNRDKATSTAFPSSKPEKENSRRRYRRHFIGHFDGEGNLSGMLSDLKLIYKKSSSGVIDLTDTGWRISESFNPILDNRQENPSHKLSEAEKSILINQVIERVPREKYVFSHLIQIVSDGSNRPGAIDEYLRNELENNNISNRVSDAHVSSQRSGAISRMEDLDLIERERNGVKIFYKITDNGSRFMEKLEG